MTIATPLLQSKYYCGLEIQQRYLTAKFTLILEKMKLWGTCPGELIQLTVHQKGNCFGLSITAGIEISREYAALHIQGLDPAMIAERLKESGIFFQRLRNVASASLDECLLISMLSSETYKIIHAHDLDGFKALKAKYKEDPDYLRILTLAWNTPVEVLKQLYDKRIDIILPLFKYFLPAQSHQWDEHVASQHGLTRIGHYGGVFSPASFTEFFANLHFSPNTQLLVLGAGHSQELSIARDDLCVCYDPNREVEIQIKSKVGEFIWNGLRLVAASAREPITMLAFMPTADMSTLHLEANEDVQQLTLKTQALQGLLPTVNCYQQNLLILFILLNDHHNVSRVLPYLPVDNVTMFRLAPDEPQIETSPLAALIYKNNPILLDLVLDNKDCDINRKVNNQKQIVMAAKRGWLHSFRKLIRHPKLVLDIDDISQLRKIIYKTRNLAMLGELYNYLANHKEQLKELVQREEIIIDLSLIIGSPYHDDIRFINGFMECYKILSLATEPVDKLVFGVMHKKMESWLAVDRNLSPEQQAIFESSGIKVAPQKVNPFDLDVAPSPNDGKAEAKEAANPFEDSDDEAKSAPKNIFDYLELQFRQIPIVVGNPFEDSEEALEEPEVERAVQLDLLYKALKAYILGQDDIRVTLLQDFAKFPELLGLQQSNGLTPIFMCILNWRRGQEFVPFILNSEFGFSSLNTVYQSPTVDPQLQGTPLHVAYALRNRAWIVQEVFSRVDKLSYLNINIQHPVTKESFIQQVARAVDVEMINQLVVLQEQNRIFLDPNLVDSLGKTLFHTLVEHGFRDQALRLLKCSFIANCVDLQIQDHAGNNILHTAHLYPALVDTHPFGDDLEHYLANISRDKRLNLESARNRVGKLPEDIAEHTPTTMLFARSKPGVMEPEQKGGPAVTVSPSPEETLSRLLQNI